jgi:hypothetical protein
MPSLMPRSVLVLSHLLCALLAVSFDAGEKQFLEIATSVEMISDKVVDHKYQIMYGLFLMPMRMKYRKVGKKIKFLEIGLGCNMEYGPGASVKLWKRLFGTGAEIWEAEANSECVEKYQKTGDLDGINVLIGDQLDFSDLKSWVNISGGRFDVILDDGGHHSDHILNALTGLWDQLNPGGLYFLEDLHVQTTKEYKKDGYPAPVSVIQSWIEFLLVTHSPDHPPTTAYHSELLKRFPPPSKLKWIFCQMEACVLGKE